MYVLHFHSLSQLLFYHTYSWDKHIKSVIHGFKKTPESAQLSRPQFESIISETSKKSIAALGAPKVVLLHWILRLHGVIAKAAGVLNNNYLHTRVVGDLFNESLLGKKFCRQDGKE